MLSRFRRPAANVDVEEPDSDRDGADQADRISWGLLVFGLVRAGLWMCLMGCVGLGLAGVPWLHWAVSIGRLVVFITLISLYANFEGELGQVTGAWAAIQGGRAHQQGLDVEEQASESYAAILQRVEATQTRVESLAEELYAELLRQER